MKRSIVMLRRLAIVALAAGIGGCGDDATEPGSDDRIAGRYVLLSANGEDLPATAVTWEDQSGTWQAVIRSGTLELDRGEYEADFVVDFLVDGVVSLESATVTTGGTYTASGARVTFRSANPAHGTTEGTLEGDILTVSQPIENYGTFTATYQREQPNN